MINLILDSIPGCIDYYEEPIVRTREEFVMLFGDCCGDDTDGENENPDGVSSQECDEDQNGDNEPVMSRQREKVDLNTTAAYLTGEKTSWHLSQSQATYTTV
jgi:hypothetical protein